MARSGMHSCFIASPVLSRKCVQKSHRSRLTGSSPPASLCTHTNTRAARRRNAPPQAAAAAWAKEAQNKGHGPWPPPQTCMRAEGRWPSSFGTLSYPLILLPRCCCRAHPEKAQCLLGSSGLAQVLPPSHSYHGLSPYAPRHAHVTSVRGLPSMLTHQQAGGAAPHFLSRPTISPYLHPRALSRGGLPSVSRASSAGSGGAARPAGPAGPGRARLRLAWQLRCRGVGRHRRQPSSPRPAAAAAAPCCPAGPGRPPHA